MNQSFLKAAARFSAMFGVNVLFYKFNCRAKRILTFHNVLPDDLYVANVANGVSCSESAFRQTIRELKKRWKFSTDLFDPSSITITFDDGYLNQYDVAAKILCEEGDIPAIVFVAGDVLDGKVLTVDKLLHWASHVPQEVIASRGYVSRQELWEKEIWPRFNGDAATKGLGLFAELDGIYPFDEIMAELPSEYVRFRLTGISSSQLDDLRRRGWMVGWHTRSHYPLARLSLEEKRLEMAPPSEMRDVVFSFPYGEMQSVDEESVSLAKELGFPCAVSNTQTAGALHCRHFLPRTSVPADGLMRDFALSGAKHFLKFGSFLPTVR